jgi:hypothetical protein
MKAVGLCAPESVNRLIMVHGLEAANHLDGLMEEAWRVMVPNGRALFIVANRRGFWARRDGTPFGMGRPFSSGQLRQLMRRTGFVQGQTRPALLLPPFSADASVKLIGLDRPIGGVFNAAIRRRLVDGGGEKSACADRLENGIALSLGGGYPTGFIGVQTSAKNRLNAPQHKHALIGQ